MKRKLRMTFHVMVMSISMSFLSGLTFSQSTLWVHARNEPTANVLTSRDLEISVSGKVSDETGQPLPGVNILVKGTTTGTTSDASGNYKLTIPDKTQFSFFPLLVILRRK